MLGQVWPTDSFLSELLVWSLGTEQAILAILHSGLRGVLVSRVGDLVEMEEA